MTSTEAAATTESVLDHHLTAFGNRDVSDILSDNTEESVIVTDQGTFRGVDEIRGFFEDLIAESSQEGVTMDVTQRTVEGEYAFLVWEAETPDNVYELAIDAFHVPDQTIRFQSFAGKVTPKA